MTINVNSWQEFIVFFLSATGVITLGATIHWRLFAAPLLKKIFSPYRERLEIVTRVVRDKNPEEYEKAEADVVSDRMIRGSI